MAGHVQQPGWGGGGFRLLEHELLPQMGSDFEEAPAGPGWLSSDTDRALAPEAERHHRLWVGRKIHGSLRRGKQEVLGSRCAVGRMLVLWDRTGLRWPAGPAACGGCRVRLWVRCPGPRASGTGRKLIHSLKERGVAPVLSCGNEG